MCSSWRAHDDILIQYAEFVTRSIHRVCDSCIEFVTHVARDVYTTTHSCPSLTHAYPHSGGGYAVQDGEYAQDAFFL